VWFVKADKQAGGVHLRCSQHCDPEIVSWPLYAPCYFDCLVYYPANSQTSAMSTFLSLQISSQDHAYAHRKSTQRDTLRNFSNLNVPSPSQDKNYSNIFVIFFGCLLEVDRNEEFAPVKNAIRKGIPHTS
jgi:hypothetical protein